MKILGKYSNDEVYELLIEINEKLDQLTKERETIREEKQQEEIELLRKAYAIALEEGEVSVTSLRKRLKVGYYRAVRYVNELERRGIIEAYQGSKPRKLIRRGE